LLLDDFLEALLHFAAANKIVGNLVVKKITGTTAPSSFIGVGAASFVDDAELGSHLRSGTRRVYGNEEHASQNLLRTGSRGKSGTYAESSSD